MDAKSFNALMSGVLDSGSLNQEVVYDLFLEQLKTKLKEGQTLEVKGVGFFKREDVQTVLFVNEQGGEEELFEKINLGGKSESAYDFKEDVFFVGGKAPVVSAEEATDEEQVEKLNLFSEALNEKIDSFPVLDNFDPLEYSSKEKTDLPENNFTEDFPEELHEEIKENLLTEELEYDLAEEESQKEDLASEEENDSEQVAEDDLAGELAEELSDQNLEDEKLEDEVKEPEDSHEEEIEPEEQEEATPEMESQENEVLDEKDLESVFSDIEESDIPSIDEPEETSVKEEEEKEKPKKKKFKLFGKKEGKEKKEKKPKKEKKKKNKKGKKEEAEGEEKSGDAEEKKGLSKKLLIILIAVFVLLTLGGIYYFFFMGSDEEPQHEANDRQTEIADSIKKARTPITEKELGAKEDKTPEVAVDIHNPQKKDEEGYNLIDPRLLKEFPNEKRITHTIYFAKGKYMVQLSSWRDSEKASQIVQKLYTNGFNAFVVKAYLPQLGGTWYRVRVGFFDTLKEAKEFLRKREYLYVR